MAVAATTSPCREKTSNCFNVSDLYTVGDHYFDMLRIPVVSGKTFAAHSGQSSSGYGESELCGDDEEAAWMG
jgi:hypothetical protein